MNDSSSEKGDVHILETAEDIRARREQVLNRYNQFKEAARDRRSKLEQSRLFQYFRRDVDEVKLWIGDKVHLLVSEQIPNDLPEILNRIQRHQTFVAEITAHKAVMQQLEEQAANMVAKGHYARDQIERTLEEISECWTNLVSKLADRERRLFLAQQLATFCKECDQVNLWMQEKESLIVSEDLCVDLEQVRALQKKYEEFQKELVNYENEIISINRQAERLIDEGHPDSADVRRYQRIVNENWQRLKQLSMHRQERLFGVHEMQRLARDINDTLQWVEERSTLMRMEGLGNDLATIYALQRKHETFRRELDSMSENVQSLSNDANRLTQVSISKHDLSREDEVVKADEEHEVKCVKTAIANLREAWTQLLDLAEDRTAKLSTLVKYERCVAQCKDLLLWLKEMRNLVSGTIKADDVSSAEALVETHHEYRGEIDARNDNFNAIQLLYDDLSSAEEQIHLDEEQRACLKRMNADILAERDELNDLWLSKFTELSQLLDYQIFVRNVNQLTSWIDKQQAFLDGFDETFDKPDDVEVIIRKYDNFVKSLAVHQSKVEVLDKRANELIAQGNQNSDQVAMHRDRLRQMQLTLDNNLQERRHVLRDLERVFNFERDCDDLQSWAADKLKIANSQDYVDPTNLSDKYHKHTQFVHEVNAAQPTLRELISRGESIIEEMKLNVSQVDRIKEQITSLNGIMLRLNKLTHVKSDRFEDALRAQQFIRESEQLYMWLDESLNQLNRSADELGRDIASAESLLKRHEELESEILMKKERLDVLTTQAEEFERANHFDCSNLLKRHVALVDRMNSFVEPVKQRRQSLELAFQYFRLLSDFDDEEAWIREREPLIVCGSSRSKDLLSVQNMCRKHKALLTEIQGHEARIRDICNQAEDMINQSHHRSADIKRSLIDLQNRWHQLKDKAFLRKQVLDSSLQTRHYFADVVEAEMWMKDKIPALSSQDFGRDEDSAYSIAKKHKQLSFDIETFGENTLSKLREQFEACMTSEASVHEKVEGSWKSQYMVALNNYQSQSSKELSVKKGDVMLLLGVVHKDWVKVELDDKQGFVPAQFVKRINSVVVANASDGGKDQPCSPTVALQARHKDLEELYATLLEMCSRRQMRLDETLDAFRIIREAGELIVWIGRKENKEKVDELEPEIGTIASKDVEELQRRFEDFKKELKANETRVSELNEIADKLLSVGDPQSDAIKRIEEDIQKLNTDWERLKEQASRKETMLMDAYEVKRYNRNTDEAFEWLQDKANSLEEAVAEISSGTSGYKSMATIKRLQRKHEAFERDLNALSDRVRELDEMAGRLVDQHPEQAQEIYDKQTEIQKTWTILAARVDEKKAHLIDAHDFSRFISDFNDLIGWLQSMTQKVSESELADDVPGAEALLERLHEHRTEIDARATPFQTFEEFGHQLIQTDHYAKEEIQQKLDELIFARDELEFAWKERQRVLDQCLELQLFNRDCDTAEQWMEARERSMTVTTDVLGGGEGESANGAVEAALKRHEDIDRAISAQQDKISLLTQFAEQLIEQEHYQADGIKTRLEQVLIRWDRLKHNLVQQKALLCESQTLRDFSRDADDIEAWIAERLTIATATAPASIDDASLDLSGSHDASGASGSLSAARLTRLPLQSRSQRQQVFEAELAANAERVNAVVQMGRSLIDARRCGGIEAQVDARLCEIIEQWEFLVKKTNEKTLKIQEASKHQAFNAGVKDLEFWLSETERSLESNDLGRDISSVNSLIKKHALIDADIVSHQQSIDDLTQTADELFENLGSEQARQSSGLVTERYKNVKKMSMKRKAELEHSSVLHQFLRDLDELDASINEKSLRVMSVDAVRDLSSAHDCRNKHKRLENELEHRLKPLVERNLQLGRELIGSCEESPKRRNESTETSTGMASLLPTLTARIESLEFAWNQLLTQCQEKTQSLEDSLAYYEWYTLFAEECEWLKNKQQSFDTFKQSESMGCVEEMLKQHDTDRESELLVHLSRSKEICENGQRLVSTNRHTDSIKCNISTLTALVENIDVSYANRRQKLVSNLAYVQYLWRANAVESWIGARINQLDAIKDNFSNELSVIHHLLDRQDLFEVGLNAFDGIDLLGRLRLDLPEDDELIGLRRLSASRHEEVLTKWQFLLNKSSKRREKLSAIADRYKEIDELYLAFAKKASAFNSWYENVEEDLSDPVKCNSYEEVQALIESQEELQKSLEHVRREFDEVEVLDNKIKELNVGPNPYTWFTMHTLQDTWQNLERVVREREASLVEEHDRQLINKKLCLRFAEEANNLYDSLQELRHSVCGEAALQKSISEQIACVRAAQVELSGVLRTRLDSIEGLNGELNERLVMKSKYCQHSSTSLAQQWDHLHMMLTTMLRNLNDQQDICTKDHGVSALYLKECKMMFQHFDKERVDKLDHSRFKSCLRALGYDLGAELNGVDMEFNRYLDQVDFDRSGWVTLDNYMNFMISQETEHIQYIGDLVVAFKTLTEHSHRPYITKEELEANLPQTVVDYCISKMPQYVDAHNREVKDAYDYEKFVFTHFVDSSRAANKLSPAE